MEVTRQSSGRKRDRARSEDGIRPARPDPGSVMEMQTSHGGPRMRFNVSAGGVAAAPISVVKADEQVEYVDNAELAVDDDAHPSRWFQGRMEPAACEECVRSCMQGDFLVRQSSSSDSYVLTVNDCQQPINFHIKTTAHGQLQFAQRAFTSLDDVIDFIRLTPLKSTVQQGNRLVLANAAIVAPWFATSLNRAECEAKVRAARHGDFLVRISSTRDKYNLVVNDRGAVYTFSIARQPGNKFVFGGIRFETVDAAIEYFKLNPFKSATSDEMKLREPAEPMR